MLKSLRETMKQDAQNASLVPIAEGAPLAEISGLTNTNAYSREDMNVLAEELLHDYPDEVDVINNSLYNCLKDATKKKKNKYKILKKPDNYPYCAFAYKNVTLGAIKETFKEHPDLQQHLIQKVGSKLNDHAVNTIQAFRGTKYHERASELDEKLMAKVKDGDLISFEDRGGGGHVIRAHVDKNGKKTFTSFNNEGQSSLNKAQDWYGQGKRYVHIVHINDYINDETVNYLTMEQQKNPQQFAQEYPKDKYLANAAKRKEQKSVMEFAQLVSRNKERLP